MPAKISRGIRNNNPGNIDRNATKWQGMADDQTSDERFIVFKSPQYGIRALTKVLLTYANTHGLNTPRAIINRYAPPTENNTEAYINTVARELGVEPDTEIDVDDAPTMLILIRAIIRKENQIPGQPWREPYSEAVLLEGMRMAGVSNAPPPKLRGKIAALCTAGCGTVGSALSDPDNLQKGMSFLQPLVAISPVIKAIFVFLSVAATAYVVFGITKSRKETGA